MMDTPEPGLSPHGDRRSITKSHVGQGEHGELDPEPKLAFDDQVASAATSTKSSTASPPVMPRHGELANVGSQSDSDVSLASQRPLSFRPPSFSPSFIRERNEQSAMLESVLSILKEYQQNMAKREQNEGEIFRRLVTLESQFDQHLSSQHGMGMQQLQHQQQPRQLQRLVPPMIEEASHVKNADATRPSPEVVTDASPEHTPESRSPIMAHSWHTMSGAEGANDIGTDQHTRDRSGLTLAPSPSATHGGLHTSPPGSLSPGIRDTDVPGPVAQVGPSGDPSRGGRRSGAPARLPSSANAPDPRSSPATRSSQEQERQSQEHRAMHLSMQQEIRDGFQQVLAQRVRNEQELRLRLDKLEYWRDEVQQLHQQQQHQPQQQQPQQQQRQLQRLSPPMSTPMIEASHLKNAGPAQRSPEIVTNLHYRRSASDRPRHIDDSDNGLEDNDPRRASTWSAPASPRAARQWEVVKYKWLFQHPDSEPKAVLCGGHAIVAMSVMEDNEPRVKMFALRPGRHNWEVVELDMTITRRDMGKVDAIHCYSLCAAENVLYGQFTLEFEDGKKDNPYLLEATYQPGKSKLGWEAVWLCSLPDRLALHAERSPPLVNLIGWPENAGAAAAAQGPPLRTCYNRDTRAMQERNLPRLNRPGAGLNVVSVERQLLAIGGDGVADDEDDCVPVMRHELSREIGEDDDEWAAKRLTTSRRVGACCAGPLLNKRYDVAVIGGERDGVALNEFYLLRSGQQLPKPDIPTGYCAAVQFRGYIVVFRNCREPVIRYRLLEFGVVHPA